MPEKWTGSDFGKIQRRQSPWTLPLLVGKRKEAQQKNNREAELTATGLVGMRMDKSNCNNRKIRKNRCRIPLV